MQGQLTPEFRVTRAWISANGAWTAQMLSQVGIEWPPLGGWVDSLIGRSISADQKAAIERLHAERVVKQQMRHKRHERMQEEVYYTWPDGRGGFLGSSIKPIWWGAGQSPKAKLR